MTAPAIPAPAKGRLGNGQLRRQVAEWLAARPGPHTVGEVAKDLGRSAGAVGNALTTLADRAEAARLAGKPVRYEANAATAAITPKAPVPPKPAPAAAAPSPAASPAPPAAPKAAPGPVTRPGGQVYRPRVLAGMADVEALRTLRAEGVPALLSGPPGTGKTSLVEAAFPDLVTVAGDGDTTVGDFVGEYTQKPDGTYEFIYGPLIRAMQEGRVLFIDDATLISPAVLAVCYPAMDGRREVIVKAHKGEAVTAADGFYVVAGHNPGVHGAVLTEALSSRFTFQFDVATDYELARSLGIDSRAITAARNLATRQANGETGWAPQLRELLAFAKVSRIFGLDTSLANLAGVAPAEDRDVVAAPWRRPSARRSPRSPSAARSNPPCLERSAVMSATPPAPAPEKRLRPDAAWLAFSAKMTGQVPAIADRADLTVTVAPGAGRGAPACFVPASAASLLRADVKRHHVGQRIFQTTRDSQSSGLRLQRGPGRGPQTGSHRGVAPFAAGPPPIRPAVSLWLSSGMPAVEVARRVGCGVGVMLKIYAHCIDGQADAANQRIADALGTAEPEPGPGDEVDDNSGSAA
jgi:nitric oxide reductase NorQ protein